MWVLDIIKVVLYAAWTIIKSKPKGYDKYKDGYSFRDNLSEY